MTLDTAMQKYYNSVYSFVYGKTDKDTHYTEECCNTVFFLFSLNAKLIDDSAVYSWLIKTANNKIKEYLRKIEKEKRVIQFNDSLALSLYTSELTDLIVSESDIETVKEKLLSLLSEEDRQMYDDYFLNKLTYVEIAAKMGIDRNTVSKRVRMIRNILEEEVSKIF